MAFGTGTTNAIGSAVSDIFAGFGAETQASLKAQGIKIGAEGTRLSAASLRIKAGGDLAEAGNYDLAAALARKNIEYTQKSTAIQQVQLDRQINLSMGSQRAGFGGAGLKESGSAIDLLADSASQGALAKDVLTQQGLITEEGYQEQAKSYDVMAAAGRAAAAGEMDIAGKTDKIADETDILAMQTEQAGHQAATGDFIAAGIQGAAAVASLFIP